MQVDLRRLVVPAGSGIRPPLCRRGRYALVRFHRTQRLIVTRRKSHTPKDAVDAHRSHPGVP